MNWSGGCKNRFKNANQRKASSQQQARIPFIDNALTVPLKNNNNNASSNQDLKDALFVTPCYPNKPSPPNSNSLFMVTPSYLKPSPAYKSINAYEDINSFMVEQKSSEKPHNFLLGNKFSNITSGSDSDSDLDSSKHSSHSKLSSTNYSPVFSEDNTSSSSHPSGTCQTNAVLNKGIEYITLPDSEDERNTGNSKVQRKEINLTYQQSFDYDDRSSPNSLNSLSPTRLRSPSPKNISELGFLSPKQSLEATSSHLTFSAMETSDQQDSQNSTQTPSTSYLPDQGTPSFVKSLTINPATQTEEFVTPIPRKHVRFARQQRSRINRSTPSSDGEPSFTTPIPDYNQTATEFQHQVLATPIHPEDETEMSSASYSSPQPDLSLAESPVQSPDNVSLKVSDKIAIPDFSSQDLSNIESPNLDPTNFPSDQPVCYVPPEFPSVDGSNASGSSMKAKKLPRTKLARMQPHYSQHYPCHCRVRTVIRKIKIRDAATQTSP